MINVIKQKIKPQFIKKFGKKINFIKIIQPINIKNI